MPVDQFRARDGDFTWRLRGRGSGDFLCQILITTDQLEGVTSISLILFVGQYSLKDFPPPFASNCCSLTNLWAAMTKTPAPAEYAESERERQVCQAGAPADGSSVLGGKEIYELKSLSRFVSTGKLDPD